MNDKKIRAVALGELLVDMASESADAAGYPTLKANPGGAPANFLAALTAYGISAGFIGRVGDDAFGKMLRRTLENSGIDCSALQVDRAAFTTLAFVTLDESGDRSFSFARKPGADTRLELDDTARELIKNAELFHFGSLSLTDEPARSATIEAVRLARESGCIISCDPNLRLPLWESAESAQKWMTWAVEQADIVKISDEEAKFLYGLSPEDCAGKLLREGKKAVFVTLGKDGCYYAAGSEHGYAKGPAVRPVDTTGAGDIFGGAAVSMLMKGESPRRAAEFACCAASLSTEKKGGISSVVPLDEVMHKLTE